MTILDILYGDDSTRRATTPYKFKQQLHFSLIWRDHVLKHDKRPEYGQIGINSCYHRNNSNKIIHLKRDEQYDFCA